MEVPGAPSDNTTGTAVVAAFRQEGYDADLWAKPGGLVLCGACHATSPAGAFAIGLQRRLEGASDPDDMQLVVGVTCPACGARGVLSLQYGPGADPDDADVVVALPR
ncbi:MAG: hypothetical protein ABIS47_01245 [Acidimicrobiales bacterium]